MKKLLFIWIGLVLSGLAQAEVIETRDGLVVAKNDTLVFFQSTSSGLQPTDTVVGLYSRVNNFVESEIRQEINDWRLCCKNVLYSDIVALYKGGIINIGISSKKDSVVGRYLWFIPNVERFAVWKSVKYEKGKDSGRLTSINQIKKDRSYQGANLIQIFSLLACVLIVMSLSVKIWPHPKSVNLDLLIGFILVLVCVGFVALVYVFSSWLVIDSSIHKTIQNILPGTNFHTQISLLSLLVTLFLLSPTVFRVKSKKTLSKETKLLDLGFKGATLRAVKVLSDCGVVTIGDTLSYGKNNLQKFRHVGPRSIQEISSKLRESGFKLT